MPVALFSKCHMCVCYPTESVQPPQEVNIVIPILLVKNVQARRGERAHQESGSKVWQGLGWDSGPSVSRTHTPDLYYIFFLYVKFNPFCFTNEETKAQAKQ